MSRSGVRDFLRNAFRDDEHAKTSLVVFSLAMSVFAAILLVIGFVFFP